MLLVVEDNYHAIELYLIFKLAINFIYLWGFLSKLSLSCHQLANALFLPIAFHFVQLDTQHHPYADLITLSPIPLSKVSYDNISAGLYKIMSGCLQFLVLALQLTSRSTVSFSHYLQNPRQSAQVSITRRHTKLLIH